MKQLFVLTFLTITLSVPTWAQLAVWEVAGDDAVTTNPLSADSTDSNVASANLSLGSGVSASSAGSTFGASGFNQTSLADAITDGDYISITLAASTGYELNFSGAELLFGLSSATDFNVALLSDQTGLTSSDSLFTLNFATASPASQSVALSGITALQGVSGTTELRLYGWRTTSGTSTFRFRSNSGDDITISGTSAISAVPEPSTYAAFAGLAMLGFAAYRRRNRNRAAAALAA